MVSQDKLIKNGIRYTDALFDEIIHRLEQGVLLSDTLEAFLELTKEYTSANPLVSTGYDNTLLNLILAETNNHKFSRPAQKELVRVTIENQVGDLIRDVGEDIRVSVRDIVKEGYNNNQSQDEIAQNISEKITAIKNKRARAIARTEIARAATVSDYVINKERGATHFYVECRNTACPVCKEAWHTGWTVENDDGYTPSETSAGGKGWIGDKTYPMSDTSKLPPIHPNCRCVPYFIRDDERAKEIRNQIHVRKPGEKPSETKTTTTTAKEPTLKQLKAKLTKDELEQVDWAKGVLKSKFIKESGKQIARQTLDELYAKALGKTTVETTVKKPKPQPTTPKEPTTSKPNSVESMTSQELYESMTKADKKKYDKAKAGLEKANKNLEQLGENPLLLDIKKKRLLELQKLEQKQRDKLNKKSQPKKKTIKPQNERTIDAIHNDMPVPTDKLIPGVERWIDKRHKNTIEYGYHFDIETGEIVDGWKDGELRGKKGGVAISDKGKKYGSIHSHPDNGMSPPSAEDFSVFRCKEEQHHLMVSKHEIWYVEATDSFGIGAIQAQLDLQRAHGECVAKGKAKVAEDIKKGKVSADEDAIKLALDKAVGDELLNVFNSPPWNKTLTVKRYYR